MIFHDIRHIPVCSRKCLVLSFIMHHDDVLRDKDGQVMPYMFYKMMLKTLVNDAFAFALYPIRSLFDLMVMWTFIQTDDMLPDNFQDFS